MIGILGIVIGAVCGIFPLLEAPSCTGLPKLLIAAGVLPMLESCAILLLTTVCGWLVTGPAALSTAALTGLAALSDGVRGKEEPLLNDWSGEGVEN